jgi:hypothetical protein
MQATEPKKEVCVMMPQRVYLSLKASLIGNDISDSFLPNLSMRDLSQRGGVVCRAGGKKKGHSGPRPSTVALVLA